MEMQLSNLNLIDDTLADSVSLKKQRLNRISKTAVNPNPNPIQKPIQKPEQVLTKESEELDEENDSYYMDEEKGNDYGGVNYSSIKGASKSPTNNAADEKKILGMKPAIFYTLLTAVAIVGGVIVYNKFIKKGGKGKSLDIGSAAPKVGAVTAPISGASTPVASASASTIANVSNPIPSVKI